MNLDDWKVEQYEEIAGKGNAKAKQLYEAIVPITYRRLRRGDDSVSAKCARRILCPLPPPLAPAPSHTQPFR